MSTKAKRSSMFLYPIELETPPDADRLKKMIAACASGNEIDASMRREIVSALKSVMVRQRNDELRGAKGRAIAMSTFEAASLAKELLDQHGVTSIKSATRAACESANARLNAGLTLAAVERTYRKLDSDGAMTIGKGAKRQKIVMVLVNQAAVADALARVPRSARSGNK